MAGIQGRIEKILKSDSFEPFHAPNLNSMLEQIHQSSMDLVLLYVSLEREFGVQFSLEEISSEDFAKLETLVQMVEKKAPRP